MICAHAQCKKTNTDITEEHAGHKVQTRPASKALFHFLYIISFVCSTNIPHDNRIVLDIIE